jgi:hypothetical protein
MASGAGPMDTVEDPDLIDPTVRLPSEDVDLVEWASASHPWPHPKDRECVSGWLAASPNAFKARDTVRAIRAEVGHAKCQVTPRPLSSSSEIRHSLRDRGKYTDSRGGAHSGAAATRAPPPSGAKPQCQGLTPRQSRDADSWTFDHRAPLWHILGRLSLVVE